MNHPISGADRPFPPGPAPAAGNAAAAEDPRVPPLLSLAAVRLRLDSVRRLLSQSLCSNTLLSKDQMDMVSAEITSAIYRIIVDGAALFSSSRGSGSDPEPERSYPKLPVKAETDEVGIELELDPESDCEIVELNAAKLLAEHAHFCDVCGKGFKRDANLRMHMRAHGNQFKTPEALAKPERCADVASAPRKTRFSCPFEGCNRNKGSNKFRPLKSVICVKNHFKRSHCPKMYSCNRCNKKSFSVLADLKSHSKHCGQSRWRCSCGTTFSRKDKLFGHMALFDGHMPAVAGDHEEKASASGVVAMEDDGDENAKVEEEELAANSVDGGFFEGLLDVFGSLDGYTIQDLLNGMGNGMQGFPGVQH
ncbi:zinc finger protein STOP1 homolog [Eucalyptus grandis]|uniref:zinc finger protein STOP1 homolog n=1 Tax=Eucalyptus grandis TaxID=71139 RepID=UPI00192E98C6|nr:zinc finger protein STOP1 homolog [Eucalyptus grandis]